MAPASSIKNRDRFWQAAGIGCFVAVFLLLFRPFGLEHGGWRDPVFWFILGFAPFNAALVLSIDVLLRRAIKQWPSLSKLQIRLAITLSIIILSNALYHTVAQQYFDWQEFLSLLWQVALIALFPTLFILVYYRKRDQAPAPASNQLLTFHDDSNRETLTVPLNTLLYVTAERNYVLIYTTSNEQPLLLRTSLKTLAGQLTNTPVIRCHRSFLVNTQQILHRKKLARSMDLSLRHTSETVPVSASYMPAIEQALNLA
ncbi:MAG: LytTR family DNA-binding domain-containing protein [Bacteroidota bacterium]